MPATISSSSSSSVLIAETLLNSAATSGSSKLRAQRSALARDGARNGNVACQPLAIPTPITSKAKRIMPRNKGAEITG